MRRVANLILAVTCLVIVVWALMGCAPKVPQEVEPPKRVATPAAMIEQCVVQPTIVYCAKRCEDTKGQFIGRPKWCK